MAQVFLYALLALPAIELAAELVATSRIHASSIAIYIHTYTIKDALALIFAEELSAQVNPRRV